MKLVADALGPYDYLAVEWLYKPVPGAVTPHDEVPELRRLLASKEGDPRCFFAQYASRTYDPRVGAGDLGDDLFRSVALQSANLKYVAEHGDGWLSGRDGDYKFREELLTDMGSARQLPRLAADALHRGRLYESGLRGNGPARLHGRAARSAATRPGARRSP